jgi:putative MATE family efflux protein
LRKRLLFFQEGNMKYAETNKNLLKIGFPIFAGFLVGQVQQITDQAFLGHVSANNLSAVGNASTTIWTTMSFLFSLGTGAAILVSQKIGEKNRAEAEKILGSTFVFSSFFAVAIFLVWFFFNTAIFRLMGVTEPILGATALYAKIYTFGVLLSGFSSAANAVYNGNGNTKPLMVASILRALINVILDWILIFGHFGFPALGIAGAAIATLISDIVGNGYAVACAFSRKLDIRLSFASIRKANLRTYINVIKIGVPAGFEEFAWNLGSILLIRFLNEVNPLAAGIFTIINTITLIPVFLFIGLGNAATTLSGRNTGAGKPEEIRTTIRAAMILCWAASIAAFAIFALFPGPITRIFTQDPEVIAQTGAMLIVCGITLLPRSANIIYGGGIRGMGDTKWMLLSQIFGTVLVLVLARVFIFNLSLAVLGLFVAVFFDEVVRGAINGWYFHSKVRKQERLIASSPAQSVGEA